MSAPGRAKTHWKTVALVEQTPLSERPERDERFSRQPANAVAGDSTGGCGCTACGAKRSLVTKLWR